jgi:hypothetical protein
MNFVGWRHKSFLWLALVVLMGCSLPAPAPPSLSAAAAQNTLDNWNPSYFKVVEFYGFYKPGNGGGYALVAYVLAVNPGEQPQKQTIFAARFQLLNRPDGQQKWFLTSLISHASGLSRRQGWDNLMIPVQDNPATASK